MSSDDEIQHSVAARENGSRSDRVQLLPGQPYNGAGNGDLRAVPGSQLRALVDNFTDVITVVSPDLTILFQAASVETLLGHCPAKLQGTKFSALVDPDGLRRLRAACAEAADGIAHGPVQLRLRCGDGSWLDGETSVRFQPEEGSLIFTTRDVRERKRVESQLRRRATQQAVVVRLSAAALAGEQLSDLVRRAAAEVAATLGADHAGVLEYVPDADRFAAIAGTEYEPADSLSTSIASAASPLGLAVTSGRPVIVRDWATELRFSEAPLLKGGQTASSIAVPVPGDGGVFGVVFAQSSHANGFNYNDGVFLQAIANILAAAIARFDGEERIRHQALHDAVTGLPNRALFEDRLTRALAAATRHSRRLAVLFLDLDHFKRINDSLGHAIGDVVLSGVAARIQGCLREEDTLARLGGDEFAILLPEIDEDEDVVQVVERISESLRVPLTAKDRDIVITASVGIAVGGAGAHDENAEALVRNADLAMYAAKRRGPGQWEFFVDHMYDTAVQRLDLTSDLYHALRRGEFEVYFQPIVALDDEAIVGMEALIRWNHPRHGLLPPAAFVPLAEETGLIVPMGRFVLRAACENLRRWQLARPQNRDLYVSVNLAAQEIDAPDLAKDVEFVLHTTGLPPSSLIIEITENVLLDNNERVMTQLRALKSLGVKIAVDDFGTGYSALHYLQRFPMDIIKIDKTFVDGLGESADQNRLVKGIIELAHGLNLKTVAEGIERREQAAALRMMHSELGQGFHFARPLPSQDMAAILAPVPPASEAIAPSGGALAV